MSGSPASESERPARHGPYEESSYTRRGVRAARELTGVGQISLPGLRWGGGRGFADERSRARGAATTTSRMRRRKRSRGRERGRWIRERSAARRWTSSIPAPSTSGSPASKSERPARHGPYEESGYTRRGVRAARELTRVGREVCARRESSPGTARSLGRDCGGAGEEGSPTNGAGREVLLRRRRG
jgi:hypothetical protein